MVGGQGGISSNDIMTWAKANGKLVSESLWKDYSSSKTSTTKISTTDTQTQQMGGGISEQLYDLKGVNTTK